MHCFRRATQKLAELKSCKLKIKMKAILLVLAYYTLQKSVKNTIIKYFNGGKNTCIGNGELSPEDLCLRHFITHEDNSIFDSICYF